jgi:hypothetical protein
VFVEPGANARRGQCRGKSPSIGAPPSNRAQTLLAFAPTLPAWDWDSQGPRWAKTTNLAETRRNATAMPEASFRQTRAADARFLASVGA